MFLSFIVNCLSTEKIDFSFIVESENTNQWGALLTQIKNIGQFCPTDNRGYIINDTSLKNIQPGFHKVIEEVVNAYDFHLKDQLHSIYIRGSVPRGFGIEQVSDLDTIAVTTKDITDVDLAWVDQVQNHLESDFDIVSGVEFAVFSIDEILFADNTSIIPFIIKTHSICVYGKDLIPSIPDYKADNLLAGFHLNPLENQIQTAKYDLKDNDDIEDILDCCVWIMKIIVRAGLALVIEREHKYTRDLYPAYQLFSRHYPEKENDMRQAVQYAVNPVEEPDRIISFLNTFGNWMIHESKGQMRT